LADNKFTGHDQSARATTTSRINRRAMISYAEFYFYQKKWRGFS
jgi:hypothetical protein